MLQFRLLVKNPDIQTSYPSFSNLPVQSHPQSTHQTIIRPPQKTSLNHSDLNTIKQRLDNMQNYRNSITTNMLGRLQEPSQGCRTCGMLRH